MTIQYDNLNNQITVVGTASDIPIVLQPKGTGALQAQVADSTATGGNARGTNAVDWQSFTRTSAAQVASGLVSTILGGARNTSNSTGTVVAGGLDNTAGGTNGVVVGGASNTAALAYGSVVGGQNNSALGIYNFIGNGFGNSGNSTSAITTQATTAVTSGSTAVTLSGSNANIRVGLVVTGTGIVTSNTTTPYTYVAAISGTSLTLSQNASATGTPTLTFYSPHGIVVGGGNNQATGSYSFIGGGGDAGTAANRNVASGGWSSVLGGFKNTASGVGSVVCGGGTYDGTSAGNGNTSSGLASFVGAGWSNTASSDGAVCIGVGNQANSRFSTTIGLYANTRGILGNLAISPCNAPLSAIYTNQIAFLVLARQTTDATATALTSDTSAAGTTNQVILPNNSAYFFTGEVISGVTGGGDTKGWTIEGVIKRGANAASTALVGTPTVTSSFADAGASTWAIAVTADTTNGGIRVTFTGQAATTIRTVAQIRTTEMTY